MSVPWIRSSVRSVRMLADSVAFPLSYDTTTPLELTRTYVEYLFSNYPLGSLEMRPINLTEPSVSIRR